MLYELREYRAYKGMDQQLKSRFRDHVLGLFEKHGIKLIGMWVQNDDPEVIIYVCGFESEEARNIAWHDFKQDPEWKTVKSESEKNGPLTESITSRLLKSLIN